VKGTGQSASGRNTGRIISAVQEEEEEEEEE
jgi:hypothetical protein